MEWNCVFLNDNVKGLANRITELIVDIEEKYLKDNSEFMSW